MKTQPFPGVIPAQVHGRRIERLCRGCKSYQITYTVPSPHHGSEEVSLWIVCRDAKGKRGKHKVERLPYVVIGDLSCPIPNVRVESSYGMMNQARARLRPGGLKPERTTSWKPKYRLLLASLALILINVWITLRWSALGVARRGGRWI